MLNTHTLRFTGHVYINSGINRLRDIGYFLCLISSFTFRPNKFSSSFPALKARRKNAELDVKRKFQLLKESSARFMSETQTSRQSGTGTA